MGFLVVATAQLQCTQGVAPCVLIAVRTILATSKPAANVQDYKPFVNIPTFGMCNSTSNPAVIATTAAAQGVHTPAPCTPAITSPWSPGASKVKIDGQKALDDASTCKCTWNGTIKVNSAGQTKVKVT